MRYTRAIVLSLFYLATLALLWLALGNWIAEAIKASGQTPDPTAFSVNGGHFPASFARVFVYPNALGFLITSLWLASGRSFVPFVRYVVPTALAGALTVPLSLLTLYLIWWIAYALRPLPGVLSVVLWQVGAALPGFITAQLLRFPRAKLGQTRFERVPAV